MGESKRLAADEVLPLVYQELRRLARARMARERPGKTLEPAGLVHEAYLRLRRGGATWETPGHFYAAAAEAMRRILIERGRRDARQKHGAGQRRVTFDEEIGAEVGVPENVALDDALRRLEARDPRLARVVELRYFVASPCRRPRRPSTSRPVPSTVAGRALSPGSAARCAARRPLLDDDEPRLRDSGSG